MKLISKIVLLCLMVLSIKWNSQAQTHTFVDTTSAQTLSGPKTLTTPIMGYYTVSSLPAPSILGRIAIVTDGTTGGDCTVGGGSALVWCRENGAAWANVGGGSTLCSTIGANTYYATVGYTPSCDASIIDNGTGTLTLTSLVTNSDGVHPAYINMVGNTTPPTLGANTFQLLGPNSNSFTSYCIQWPGAGPAAAGVFLIGAPVATQCSTFSSSQITFGLLPLTDVATQAADSVAMNATGSSASPTAVVLPACAASGHADVYDPSTHSWTCNALGTGSIGGTVTVGYIPVAVTNTSTVTASLCDQGVTTANTLTCTDTAGLAVPKVTTTGTTAGFWDLPQGSTSAAVAPCNTATSICFQAPTSVTAQLRVLAGAPASGFTCWTNSSGTMTETICPASGTMSAGPGLLGTSALNTVIASTVANAAGHFTNLQVVTSLGGTCSTPPQFNVFDGTSNTGSTVTAGSSTQTKGTGTSTAQTQTFASGDVIGIYISTAGGTCTTDSFIVSAQYSIP